MRIQSVYLNGGPAALPLLPSVVSRLQLLQEFVVEHLQLLLQASQLLLQWNGVFLCLKVLLLPAVACCGNMQRPSVEQGWKEGREIQPFPLTLVPAVSVLRQQVFALPQQLLPGPLQLPSLTPHQQDLLHQLLS